MDPALDLVALGLYCEDSIQTWPWLQSWFTSCEDGCLFHIPPNWPWRIGTIGVWPVIKTASTVAVCAAVLLALRHRYRRHENEVVADDETIANGQDPNEEDGAVPMEPLTTPTSPPQSPKGSPSTHTPQPPTELKSSISTPTESPSTPPSQSLKEPHTPLQSPEKPQDSQEDQNQTPPETLQDSQEDQTPPETLQDSQEDQNQTPGSNRERIRVVLNVRMRSAGDRIITRQIRLQVTKGTKVCDLQDTIAYQFPDSGLNKKQDLDLYWVKKNKDAVFLKPSESLLAYGIGNYELIELRKRTTV